MSSEKNTTADMEALFSEASFHCDHIASGPVPPDWVSTPQKCNFDKIYIPVSGTARTIINNRVYQLKPGMVLIFPAGSMQQGINSTADPLDKTWIHFRTINANTASMLQLLPPPECIGGKTAVKIRVIAEAMLREQGSDCNMTMLSLNMHLMQILLIAYRAPESDIRKPSEVLSKAESLESEIREKQYQLERIRSVMVFIHQNFTNEISLDELASKAFLHPTYFNREFKRLVGIPPMKYVERQRLNKSRELLANSSLSVTRIAESVGYNDPFYFSRAFKRNTGISPSAYREQIQNRKSSAG